VNTLHVQYMPTFLQLPLGITHKKSMAGANRKGKTHKWNWQLCLQNYNCHIHAAQGRPHLPI